MASQTLITAIIGDILKQSDCDAIVNSAHPSMLAGSGVCGQIHKAAGKELEVYGGRFAPLELAQAVITPAFNLPNKYIIHVSAPRFHSDSSPLLNLKKTLHNAFEAAEKNNIETVALPAIGTGIYGFSINDAVKVYAESVKTLTNSNVLKEIRFVFINNEHLGLMNAHLVNLN